MNFLIVSNEEACRISEDNYLMLSSSEIRCITAINYKFDRFSFSVFLAHKDPIMWSFENVKEAEKVRTFMIDRFIKFWGKEQVLYAGDRAGDITVASMVEFLTGIEEKGRVYGFSAVISDCYQPFHFLFNEKFTAMWFRKDLLSKLSRMNDERIRA